MDGIDHAMAQTARAKVFRVSPPNITPVWPQIEESLLSLLALRPTHTLEDVRQSLMNESAHLWLQWGRSAEAFAISEFATYPRGIWIRVWECGVVRPHTLHAELFFEQLDMWREMHGCRGFEAIGRHGWLRKFPEARVEGIVMRSTVS